MTDYQDSIYYQVLQRFEVDVSQLHQDCLVVLGYFRERGNTRLLKLEQQLTEQETLSSLPNQTDGNNHYDINKVLHLCIANMRRILQEIEASCEVCNSKKCTYCPARCFYTFYSNPNVRKAVSS